jgi:hypothetical protein
MSSAISNVEESADLVIDDVADGDARFAGLSIIEEEPSFVNSQYEDSSVGEYFSRLLESGLTFPDFS